MVVIDVQEIYKYHLVFNRRINFIRGDSGTGKSEFCRLVAESEDDPEVVVTLEGVTSVELLRSKSDFDNIGDKNNVLLIIDDFVYAKSALLLDKVNKFAVKNDLYFVFISRIEMAGIDAGKSLSYSINSVYDMDFTDGVYTLVPHYNYPAWVDLNFDVALTEDSGSGYRYLSRILKIPVECAPDGKSTVTSAVEKLLNSGYVSVLVFFDSSAFGCHMEDFVATFMKSLYKGCNIAIMSIYEFFEELLCQTNLIKPLTNELDNLDLYANQYLSWETYFEALLARLTANKQYMHTHGKSNVNYCYYASCDSCHSNVKQKCDAKLGGGDKLIALFLGTKYEFLLRIMRG